MLGLSTVYLNDSSSSWEDLLLKARTLGYNAFELDVKTPSSWIKDIKKSVQNGEAKILSVHNFCPLVEDVPPGRSVWGAYLITSEDENERRKAVDLTKRSVETALEVGASVVVVHAGEVKIDFPSGRDLARLSKDFGIKSTMYKSALDELLKLRRDTRERYLNQAARSLYEITSFAASSLGEGKVKIALENRFFLHEIPYKDEFGILFEMVKSPSLGFWYDVGHGEIFIRMGFAASHDELIEPYKNRILGFHLHDVRGMRDHYAPGEGEMNYRQFFKYMEIGTIKIIESHPYSSENAIIKAPLIFREVEDLHVANGELLSS